MRYFLLTALIALSPIARAQAVAGRWDATLEINRVSTPFRLELTGSNDHLTATLFNGEELYPSTQGSFKDGKLHLEWDYYASTIEATYKDGVFTGRYAGTRRMAGPFSFSAKRHVTPLTPSGSIPNIAGVYWMPAKSAKGEQSWRFIVRQNGPDLTAAVLRIDGDTGSIEGRYVGNNKFVISKFDGARAYLMEVTALPDGSLKVVENGSSETMAYKPEVAKAKGIAEPNDPMTHTRVKNPAEPFHFAFPDHATRKLVSNTDDRFKNKVVLVEISGSWCPNCHDEAPFLAELYRQYKSQGLEVVTLSFEEPEQLTDPTRLKAFVKQHGVTFPVLLGGDTETAQEKLPQLVNWNTWPATLFLDRKGLVRFVHAGFPSSGSGDLYQQAREDFRVQIGRLLAEK